MTTGRRGGPGGRVDGQLQAGAVRRVLIVRPDNLGDVVLFSGALRHLRARFPVAELTFCGRRYANDLLALSPFLDSHLEWEELQRALPPSAPSFPGRARVDRWVRRARLFSRRPADVLLLPLRSPAPFFHEIVSGIRAAAKVGIAGDLANQSAEDDERAERVYTHRLRLTPERGGDHELLVTRDYLRLLGSEVSVEQLWPELWTGASDRRWAEEAVPAREGVRTLAICPGVVSVPSKFYSGEKLARTLASLPEHRFRVVLFGSGAERAMCDEVARELSRCPNVVEVLDHAGRSSVRQLVEGLRRCDVVLTQETAALHIATALRKPTVGILGGGHFGRFYPWGDPEIHRAAHVPMSCYGCNWSCPFETLRCIQEIPPEVVGEELRMLLSRPVLASSAPEGE